MHKRTDRKNIRIERKENDWKKTQKQNTEEEKKIKSNQNAKRNSRQADKLLH